MWAWLLATVAAASWLLLTVARGWPVPAGPAWATSRAAWWAALACLAVAAAGAARIARTAGTAAAASPALLLRLTAAAGLVALAAATVTTLRTPGAPRDLTEATFASVLAAALAACAAAVTLRPARLAPPRRRWWRALDALAFNLAVVLVACEVAVALAGRFSASPLLHFDRVFGGAGGDEAVRATLRAYRLKPGTPFFDGAVNSRGFADAEPFAAGPRDYVAAVLADSFGVGVVPISYNFTTVAERSLAAALAGRYERVAVHNLGVASIGPPEYYYLLHREALPLNPSLVVVCLFVGNDLGSPLARPQVTMASLASWRSWQLVARLAALGEARTGGAVEFTDWGHFERGVPPWVDDFRLERPSFSEERFMQIEMERAGWFSLSWAELPARLDAVCRTLGEFHAVLGDRLLVALLPDEMQVNDALWQEVLRRVPAPGVMRRDLPQQQLVPCCERSGIHVLDLLPALRSAQRTAPTYHLRDTHWNAYGNRVAGETLAAWIVAHRSPGSPPR